MSKGRFLRGAAMMTLIVAMAMAPIAAHSENVGAAAAVKPSSTGTPPGGATRNLNIGTDIVSRERIRTTQGGSLQVMFLDKTTLTIGPDSDMVIDEFVYKPGATGRFSASLTKGALRFVGGQISHTAGATINTPAATIGIRGGAALITHDAACQARGDKPGVRRQQCTKVVCTGGVCRVTALNGSRTLQLRINQAVEIDSLSLAQPFNVQSVTLNDVAKGGDGGIVGGPAGNNGNQGFAGQDTVNETVLQAPEPPPPILP